MVFRRLFKSCFLDLNKTGTFKNANLLPMLMTTKIADLNPKLETSALKNMSKKRFEEIFPVPRIEPRELSDVLSQMIKTLGSGRGMLPPKGLYSVVIEEDELGTYYFYLRVGRWDDNIYKEVFSYDTEQDTIQHISNN